jgi:hypothetical protein
MHFELFVVAKRRKERDGDDRAVALVPLAARPDAAPGHFFDECLKGCIEFGGRGFGARYVIVAKDRSPRALAICGRLLLSG